MQTLFILLLFAISSSYARKPIQIDDFESAKKVAWEIHKDHPFTLYCNCQYKGKHVLLHTCGYKSQGDTRRANRVEWEHVVPAEAFGQSFAEWRDGSPQCVRKGRPFRGRKCAKFNADFSRMEGDLYNMWPEIGELNNLRSNFSMAELETSDFDFGRCHARIHNRKFSPVPEARGIVARVYMYMNERYPGRGIISDKNRKMFENWDQAYPVTQWECTRARLIEARQGIPNLVLQSRCSRLTASQNK